MGGERGGEEVMVICGGVGCDDDGDDLMMRGVWGFAFITSSVDFA